MNHQEDSKLIYVLLAATSTLAVILLAIGYADPVTNSLGIVHPEIDGMRAGGNGAERLEHIGHFAYAFMCLVFLLLVRVYFLFCWPEVVGGGEKNDSEKCEKEIIESVSTLIVLEVCFGHFEVKLLSPRLMETSRVS